MTNFNLEHCVLIGETAFQLKTQNCVINGRLGIGWILQ